MPHKRLHPPRVLPVPPVVYGDASTCLEVVERIPWHPDSNLGLSSSGTFFFAGARLAQLARAKNKT